MKFMMAECFQVCLSRDPPVQYSSFEVRIKMLMNISDFLLIQFKIFNKHSLFVWYSFQQSHSLHLQCCKCIYLKTHLHDRFLCYTKLHFILLYTYVHIRWRKSFTFINLKPEQSQVDQSPVQIYGYIWR